MAQNASDAKSRPRILQILPVRNTVLFPFMTLPLSVGREKSMKLLSDVLEGNGQMGVVAQLESEVDEPTEGDVYRYGTLAKILKSSDISEGTASFLVQGQLRFRIIKMVSEEPYHIAEVEYCEEDVDYSDDMEIEALYKNLKQIVHKVITLSPTIPDEAAFLVEKVPSPTYLTDMVAHYLDMEVTQKQAILETIDTKERLRKVTEIISRELELLELGSKIQSDVKDKMDHHQREAYLREQMKAIQRELGEGDEQSSEMDGLKKSIDEAGMPEEAHKSATKELKRLARMHSSSPEYQVVRTFLDWMLDLPWSKSTEDSLDIKQAEKILDEDHYDLEKVKKRILEFLAVRKLKNDLRGPILCLQGPPGVGKTSLGKSIARALGRKFFRMSLGGVHDEAEIRGHRRTYIGAMPGRILKGLKKTESNNPVFMLDEIEKLGRDFRGDPASALLEVLDPEQNFAFSDHYIEVPFDLSNVMFITTANSLDTVPPALLDRMEVINIAGYTEEEKLHIARNFLIGENLEEHGLTEDKIEFEDKAISLIINSYTKESGVRNLKREIASVCRSVAMEVALGSDKKDLITPQRVEEIIGKQKFYSEVAERVKHNGVATGLAWTPYGGDILFVEATMMKGKGSLTLTGQLGDVMKESAQAAMSYIRSKAESLNIDENIFADNDVHLHVPAGAIPKDGPSAGVTMMTALTSMLTCQPVSNDVAMTGEITLRGTVLPIGGVKEKVLAAKRAGIKTILLPEKNQKDMDDLSEDSRKSLKFVFVKDAGEVLFHSLGIQ